MNNQNLEIKIITKQVNGKTEQVISSLEFTKGIKSTHKVILELIRKFKSKLELFGTLPFETRKSDGRPTTIYFLNEQQCTLLLTFMKNNNIKFN